MFTLFKEKEKSKNLLEDHDYEEKIRHMNFKKRIEWFVDNKHLLGQNDKWEAFYDICDDYDVADKTLLNTINALIRKKGKSVW